MILIVDTYNVLHVTGVLPPELAGIDVAGLAGLLNASRYESNRVELICDGTPHAEPIHPPGRVKIRYAGPGHLADDLIAALVAESSAPKRLLVVSSDQSVTRHARRRRCKTLSSEQLLEQLSNDLVKSGNIDTVSRPNSTLPKSEVAKWMDVFRLRTTDPLPEIPSDALPDPIVDPPPPPSKSKKIKRQPTQKQPDQTPSASPLPADIIAQAEQIWAEQSQVDD